LKDITLMKTENKQPPVGCSLEPVPIGNTFYETVNFKENCNMKFKIIIIFTVIILLIGSTIGAKNKTPVSPSALIGQTIYEH